MCNLIEKYKMGKLKQVSLQRIYVSRNSVYSKQGEIGCKVNIKKCEVKLSRDSGCAKYNHDDRTLIVASKSGLARYEPKKAYDMKKTTKIQI
jgi:hypothetical protein